MKIEPNILEVLKTSTVVSNRLVLNGQLDRKTYAEVNKVLLSIGGCWDRKAKAHVFEEDAEDIVADIIDTGEYRRVKQDLGQFDTPHDLAMNAVVTAEIMPGHIVLEPSAGLGNIVHMALVRGAATVHAYELDEKRVHKLADRFSGGHVIVAQNDFLAVEPRPLYNRVVMNPPFAKQADIDHVLHAAKFLVPGGRLVAIMSASVDYRMNKKTVDFRAFVAEHGGTIVHLPEGAFKESGTSVNTVMVTLSA